MKLTCLRYLIPLKCIVVQVGSGAGWLQDNKSLAQASILLTPAKKREILAVVSRYRNTINICMVGSLYASQTTSHHKGHLKRLSTAPAKCKSH